jgi:hypothetical protein
MKTIKILLCAGVLKLFVIYYLGYDKLTGSNRSISLRKFTI